MPRASLLAAIVVTGLVACGGSDADPKEGECEDYCALVTAHCSGAHLQYSGGDTCLATCMAMPAGDPESHAGHTIACRTFAAAAAELDPTTCPEAGPGGDGLCGGNCESFCAMADELCTGDNEAFTSTAECLTACAGYDPAPPYEASQTGGDTFACRLYHLTAAAADPVTHCHHIRPVSEVCF